MGCEDDQKAGIERRDKDKQQRSTAIRAGRHSSDKAAKQCARSRGDRSKSRRSLSRHQISDDPSSDPSSSDSGSSSSSSSGGDRKRAKNKTKRFERKPHKTRSASAQTEIPLLKTFWRHFWFELQNSPSSRDGTGQQFCSPAHPEVTRNHPALTVYAKPQIIFRCRPARGP